MKKLFAMLFAIIAVLAVGCGNTSSNNSEDDHVDSAVLDLARPVQPPADFAGKRVLVAFFSRTGENFEVGYIEKGNTHIIAEQIAEIAHADRIFEIQTVNPYPADYQEMTKVAKEEQATEARPTLATRVEDMELYDVIYLGYPIWYQNLPMPVYTFLESYDFTGKTIIPFCTGMGNAMSGMEADIPLFAKGAQLRQGFGTQGKFVHNSPDQAKLEVANWLASLGYTN
ncbi:flavodoxin [Selenomonas timonae]|uniref:Flavodoxin n=1 Tax=Selenomonas timonae TaxID=2754044 RepID=A0A7G7VHA3_9FIRM|nr:flavodoxin [Selenomonas timonae]QNH53496.1 flavodoxin [Selenomonas timonae]